MCTISPVGYHLNNSAKNNNNCYNEYVDLLSLLPSAKEFNYKGNKKNDKSEEDRHRPVTKLFNSWLKALCIFASMMDECFPEQCSGLFQHVDIILEACKNFRGFGWFSYNENFSKKLSVFSALKWGGKDVDLWLNLMAPHKQVQHGPGSVIAFQKGTCFAFNKR